jgi:hypothetical protein
VSFLFITNVIHIPQNILYGKHEYHLIYCLFSGHWKNEKIVGICVFLRWEVAPARSERRRGIPRWQLEGGSRKRASYSEILERC